MKKAVLSGRWLSFFGMVLGVLIISGCVNKLPDEIPDIGVSADEINTRVDLLGPFIDNNTVKNHDLVDITVRVVTQDKIVFSKDYGARIFTYEQDKWVEIKNDMIFSESIPDQVILPLPEGNLFPFGNAAVSPYIENLKRSIPIRIILVGNLVSEGKVTEEKTAGYIDLTLTP